MDFSSYKNFLKKEYPHTYQALKKLSWNPVFFPEPVPLSSKAYRQMKKVVQSLFQLKNTKAYQQNLSQEAPETAFKSQTLDSVLMAYDFHIDEKGIPKLIEVNTNASAFLLVNSFYQFQNQPYTKEKESLKCSFESEWRKFQIEQGREVVKKGDLESQFDIKEKLQKPENLQTEQANTQQKEMEDKTHLKPPQQKEMADQTHLTPLQQRERGDKAYLKPPQQKEMEDKTHLKPPQQKERGDKAYLKPPQQRERGDQTHLKAPQQREMEDKTHLKPPQQKEMEDQTYLKPPQKTVLIDENIFNQKMLIEFFMYKDFFDSIGWPFEIYDSRLLKTDDKGFLYSPKGDRVDFVYNRSTDFYFENHPHLKKAFLKGTCAISPHPREYHLLSSKDRLCEWFFQKENQPELREIKDNLLFSKILNSENKQEIWKDRKKYFFKNRKGYGGKQAYRGASISYKKFNDLLQSLVQEFCPPSRIKDSQGREWKVDFRAYVYEDQIQQLTARCYQGQLTNFKQPGSGFALVHIV